MPERAKNNGSPLSLIVFFLFLHPSEKKVKKYKTKNEKTCSHTELSHRVGTEILEKCSTIIYQRIEQNDEHNQRNNRSENLGTERSLYIIRR
jgi:hypothetical protein